jgi:hypothetical protein
MSSPFVVAVAFWMFVAIAVVAGVVGGVLKRKQSLEPVRLAIERGQQLDPAVIEKLLGAKRIDAAHLQVRAIITIAAGIGVAVLSWFIAQVAADALYPILGVGIAVICVGVGLQLAARVLARREKRDGSAEPTV